MPIIITVIFSLLKVGLAGASSQGTMAVYMGSHLQARHVFVTSNRSMSQVNRELMVGTRVSRVKQATA